jgi:hypothetical protein
VELLYSRVFDDIYVAAVVLSSAAEQDAKTVVEVDVIKPLVRCLASDKPSRVHCTASIALGYICWGLE